MLGQTTESGVAPGSHSPVAGHFRGLSVAGCYIDFPSDVSSPGIFALYTTHVYNICTYGTLKQLFVWS